MKPAVSGTCCFSRVRSGTCRARASSLDRAVKCTVFLADIQDFAAMNAVYATYFPKDPPARSTVAASGLAGGARVDDGGVEVHRLGPLGADEGHGLDPQDALVAGLGVTGREQGEGD